MVVVKDTEADTEAEAAADVVAAADEDVVADIIRNSIKSNRTNTQTRSFSKINNNSNSSNSFIQERTIVTAGRMVHVGIPPTSAMLHPKDIAMTPRLKTEWRGITKIARLDGVG